MADPSSLSPVALQALQRLRKLAEGNDIAPGAIQIYSSEENTYAIEGTIVLSPLFEASSSSYAGGPRGRNYRMSGSRAALKSDVERLKKDFETKHAWINEAIAQLKEQPAGGWGLDDVRVSLPNQSVTLAASEPCPTCQGNKSTMCQQCQGQGSITCPHCGGRRQEICNICLGSGMNPSMQGQPCIQCQGLRYTRCRYCQGSGVLTCPSCQGNRGTACSSCNGAGIFTESVSINCGVRTQFKIKAEGLPSGLRRGLDRLGMANLANGHADIESLAPPPDEEDMDAFTAPPIQGAKQSETKTKMQKPELYYLAHLPYADLRMNFSGKKVMVGVFGKKKVLLGVPAFLDHAMESARTALRKVAKGDGNLTEILKLRLMREALKLQLAGQGQINALRRIYPFGLSPQVGGEILANMRLALNRMTFRARCLVALNGVVASATLFAGLFMTGFHNQVTAGLDFVKVAAIDFGILIAVITAFWLALSATTRFVLQQRFSGFTIPLTQKTGKTGYAMMAGIVLMFAVMVYFAPDKPSWLALVLTKMKF